jgi:hypothetical protein
MAQTLNFSINVDQSQIPAAISQLQSGINNQLQAGALQLGTMASGLSATMSGLNVMGANPAMMGFAHSMAPGQVGYALGRAPFVDRTAPMLAFMAQAGDAVKARASAIVASMDPSKIAPTISNDSRWGGAGRAVGAGVISLGTSILGGAIGTVFGGGAGGMLGYGAGMWAGDKINSITGLNRAPVMDMAKLEKLTVERRGYADIAATFMELGPRKYLPKMGEAADVESNIAFAKSLSDAFIRQENFSLVARAAGKNPAYQLELMASLSAVDPSGYRKYVAPLHQYAGTNAGAAPENLLNKAVSYASNAEILAQARGFSSVTSKEYATAAVAAMSSLSIDAYKGPNLFQRMGAAFGTQLRLGKQFGSDFVNSIRGRFQRDLGLGPEERSWVGGTEGIAKQYSAVALSEIGTFGSGTSVMYAAQFNAARSGWKMAGNIYDATSQAAALLTDPRQAIKFRLNYKDIVRSGGATDAVYRKNMLMQAQAVMQQAGGYIENEYDALTLMFNEQGMDMEQAKAQAGVIVGAGRTLITRGSGGGKIRITDRVKSKAVLDRYVNILQGEAFGLTESQARAAISEQIWDEKLFPYGIGEITNADLAAAKAGSNPELVKKLKALGFTDKNIMDFTSGAELADSYINRQMSLSRYQSGRLISSIGRGGVEAITGLAGKVSAGTYAEVQQISREMAKLKSAGKEGEFMDKMTSLTARLAEEGIKGDKLKSLVNILETGELDIGYDAAKELSKQKKNLSYSGESGKGKPGEYDMDEVGNELLSATKAMTEGMQKLIELQKRSR